MKHWTKTCGLLLLCVVLSGCGRDHLPYLETEPTQETKSDTQTVSDTQTDTGTQTAFVQVYLCGEVVHPGVYQLQQGLRICDAVEAAGGLKADASRTYWNLAEPLVDGTMLFFPTEEEAKEREASAAANGETTAPKDGRVDLNTADASELTAIPGIGQTRAAAIIAYRTEHGPFSAIEDIMKVSGIKNALFEKMKDYITIR